MKRFSSTQQQQQRRQEAEQQLLNLGSGCGAERSLPTPEVRSSNPVTAKFACTINYCIEKTKIGKEKEARNDPIL